MDDEDVRALAALQTTGNLAQRAQLRRVATCPHCRQGFGRASLPIHVRRCRALLPVEEEAEADEPPRPIRTQQVRSLVDLCLRFVTKHFESVCLDKIVAFPEAEAALIASMPSSLVHRMVVTLVKESKRVKAKSRESRATIETLESALQGARKDVAQLESARDWAATSRLRMAEQQQAAERLQRELDTAKTALASAEAENEQLRAQTRRAEKKILRLEARINMLSAEKVELQKHAKQVLRREMDATRQLALAAKSSGGNSISSSHKFLSQSQKVSSRSFVEGAPASVNRFHKAQVVYRKRPRADGSKIPYPAATLKSSAACVDIE